MLQKTNIRSSAESIFSTNAMSQTMIDYDKEHRNCSHDLKLTFPFHALLNLYTRFTMQKYKKNKKNKDIQLFFAIFASVLLIIELYNYGKRRYFKAR